MKKAMPPIIDKNSRVLILGTMPGEQSLLKNEYYGNPGNHFWKLMYEIFNEPFSSDFDHRRRMILKKGVALWDVLDTCERSGSLDSNIKNQSPNDFEVFFKKHTSIKTVVFASKMAEKYFDRYALRPPQIEFMTLPSPSGANAGWTYAKKLEKWAVLTDFLNRDH